MDEGEEESEKADLKFTFKKLRSYLVQSLQGKMEIVTDFILWGSKITADSDCSHEIERYLFLGRKSMTKLDSILKTKTSFDDKCLYSLSFGFFPIVMFQL